MPVPLEAVRFPYLPAELAPRLFWTILTRAVRGPGPVGWKTIQSSGALCTIFPPIVHLRFVLNPAGVTIANQELITVHTNGYVALSI